MVDAYGSVTWWGFSPALDLQNDDLQRQFSKMTVAGETRERDSLEILLVGAADLRHVLKTLAMRKRHRSAKIKFYIIENSLEVIARQLLFASIICEPKEKLGLKEKVELFLELFGNSLIRPQTDEFLQNKANDLIRFVTDPEYLAAKFPFVNLSNMKFKERDQLEGILKFWRKTDRKLFEICKIWDYRIRQYLGTRYDCRYNAYDWDYSMKLKDKAPIINFKEYKTWRETGVAFELRGDSSYEVCNRTLASGMVFQISGDKIAKRGYWGDIINSPYLSFGIESEEKSLFEKANDIHIKMATNISEHNVTAWIHELLTGEKYQLHPSKATKVDQKPSNHTEVNEEKLDKISEVEEHVDATESKADEKIKDVKQDNNPGDFEMGYLIPEGCTINFLPLNCFQDLSRKSKYNRLFHVVYFSNSMVHLLQDGLSNIVSDDAKLIIETSNFMLDLKKEICSQYNEKVQGLAEAAGFQTVGTCDDEKDPYAYFAYKGKPSS